MVVFLQRCFGKNIAHLGFGTAGKGGKIIHALAVPQS